MENDILKIIKEKWGYGIIISVLLWCAVWAGYDTGIERILAPGFPHGAFDLIHGLRAFLPLLAFLFVVVYACIKKTRLPDTFFRAPLGLLSLYALCGVASCVFSKDPIIALYWALMYGSVIAVLFFAYNSKDSLKYLYVIIYVNLAIAALISLGLLLFFLMQPGVIQSLNINLLICNLRPYENIGSAGAAMDVFGMAGTRATGWARYLGVIVIFACAAFLTAKKRKKTFWFFTFAISLGMLLFTKGRTEIVAFIAAYICIIWLVHKVKKPFILALIILILFSFCIVVLDIDCANPAGSLVAFIERFNHGNNVPFLTLGTDIKPIIIKPYIATLSSRTNDIWPAAFRLFLSNPLTGYGFQGDRFFLAGQNAHNTLLHVLVQTGLLGAIPFVLAFIVTLILFWRLFKNPDVAGEDRSFLIGIFAVLVFFGVRSITESVALYSADWLFVAPILAYVTIFYRQQNAKKRQSIEIAGNTIHMIKMPDVMVLVSQWIRQKAGQARWIVVTGMHGIVEGRKNSEFKKMLRGADLFVPDGISLVLLGRLQGYDIKKRVSGADIMEAFFAEAEKNGWSSFFYGDTEETLAQLQKKLKEKYPNLKIAGIYSPPFRKLTPQENTEIINEINRQHPDVLWVGLGLPKQETWIFEHKSRLQVPVVVGVGAAFKFLSGKVKRAPAWVGDMGFEWVWRLTFETKTTWRRVFLGGPVFLWIVLKDIFTIKE